MPPAAIVRPHAGPALRSRPPRRLVAFDTTSSNSNVPLADFAPTTSTAPACASIATRRSASRRRTSSSRSGRRSIPRRAPASCCQGTWTSCPPVTVWTTPPFELHERGGFVYARGSADMKGFVALAVNLAPSSRRRRGGADEQRWCSSSPTTRSWGRSAPRTCTTTGPRTACCRARRSSASPPSCSRCGSTRAT